MKLTKANKRDKARHKAKNGMVVSSKSVFIIQQAQIKRAQKIAESKVKNETL